MVKTLLLEMVLRHLLTRSKRKNAKKNSDGWYFVMVCEVQKVGYFAKVMDGGGQHV